MVPFKPYFLGQETPPYPRATSVQKCVRTPDIEDVGKTTRHGTFFEMCGNFSFGDYFKEGAIELAWDLVTKPRRRRRLRPGGEPALPERLRRRPRGGRALAQGHRPARRPDRAARAKGELLVDGRARSRRPVLGDPLRPRPDHGPDFDADRGPTCRAEDRYLEIWNLVFMQDELSAVRSQGGLRHRRARCRRRTSTPAWASSGSRSCSRASENMYEIDVMFPVIERAEELTGRRYGADHEDDVRFRVVADHVRSSMMLIGDGVTPGNEGRGYVLRRLLRRAVRSMRLLGVRGPRAARADAGQPRQDGRDLHRAATADWDRIAQVAFAEEDAFRQTLQAGTADLRPGRRGRRSSRRRPRSPATRRSRCTTPTASRST